MLSTVMRTELVVTLENTRILKDKSCQYRLRFDFSFLLHNICTHTLEKLRTLFMGNPFGIAVHNEY